MNQQAKQPSTAQIAKAAGLLHDVSLENLIAGISVRRLQSHDGLEGESVCGHPDAVDPEIVASDPDTLSAALSMPRDYCEDLIRGMRHMELAERGVGSYPRGCSATYPGLHSVAYYDDQAIWPSHLKRKMTEKEFQSIINAKVWGPSGDHNGRPFTMKELVDEWGDAPLNQVVNDFSEEAYRRFGVVLYPVFTGFNGQHNIHVSYPVISGSVIGVGWFPDATPCPGDHVNLHIDNTYTSGFQGQFGLKIHELGHTLQLYHQFTNQEYHQEPMSYRYSRHLVVGFSTGDPVFGIPRSPSVSRLEQLYDGKPVGVPWKGRFDKVSPPPDPKPGPVTDEQVERVLRKLIADEPELFDWLKGERGPHGPPGPPGRDGAGGGLTVQQADLIATALELTTNGSHFSLWGRNASAIQKRTMEIAAELRNLAE